MLLATVEPKRTVVVRLRFTPMLSCVGVWLNEPPAFSVTMLFIHFAGRLYAANRFAAQDTSRFTGRVSCVPRASSIPLTTVSTGAVYVKFEMGFEVRRTFANTNRLFDFMGSASERRSEELFVYVSERNGLPADRDSGFELSTTGWSWLMLGAFDDVDQLNRTLRRFANVPER